MNNPYVNQTHRNDDLRLAQAATTENVIKSTAAMAADKFRDGMDVAQEKLDESVGAVSALMGSFETQLRETGEWLLSGAKDMRDTAGKQMRTYPIAAFGVAFVAGVVIARLVRR